MQFHALLTLYIGAAFLHGRAMTRLGLGCALSLATLPYALSREPAPVTLHVDRAGQWQLLRQGTPYEIRGAGGFGHLELLRQIGGNTVRTWGAEQLEPANGQPGVLDQCAELGLTALVGIWVDHARHGFDYGDPASLQAQRDRVRATVRRYRDHPALLIWGLGNEMEGDGSDPRIWQELEVLARIVKEEDPHHPVCTVLAGTYNDKVRAMLEHYRSCDILGINIYRGAERVDAALAEQGWDGPFIIAEFGPWGHWEVPTTSWGAPLEPTPAEKVAAYTEAYHAVMHEGRGLCLGAFCFIWGQKQEKTATWYGMFLPTGEKTPVVDAMGRAWAGVYPPNRSPVISALDSTVASSEVPAETEFTVTATVSDPENDRLSFDWQVVAESTEIKFGGDRETAPPVIDGCVQQADGATAVIRAPSEPGAYRVFLYVRDGAGGGSAGNFPFFVR